MNYGNLRNSKLKVSAPGLRTVMLGAQTGAADPLIWLCSAASN